MRYYTKEGTFLLRGLAYAVGTDLPPGGRTCTAVLLAPASAACPAMPAVELAAARHGLDPDAACGLVTDADPRGTVVAQYDRAMAFALADGDRVALIVWTATRVSPADAEQQLEAIAAACPVRPANCLLVSDGEEGELRLEPLLAAGAAAVREALARSGTARREPSFLIYSRFGGGHWVAWSAESCPYYPCHHCEGQRCDFCYCPLYPCEDASLGEEVTSSTAGAVWNCSACTLLHEPAVADHLRRNPMASLEELKRVIVRP
ncbi:MAG: cysteine-rich small domain-containing protein [Methanospirillum sp.]